MIFKRSDNINSAIIKGISVAIVFFAAVALVLCAVAAFFYEGEFISALSDEVSLSPWFYVTTVTVLLVSSVVYTPFSYGISMYFLKSKTEKSKFSDIFYLFNNKRLLLKAIAVDSVRRMITMVFRIVILFFAVVIELAVLRLCLESKESVAFVVITVVLWCFVIAGFLYIKFKFILCKYVLIISPDSSVYRCIKVGYRAITGKTAVTLQFYIKYIAIYIFTFFTLGLAGAKRVNRSRDSFCTYAVRLVSNY